jgi:hypothetical protein
MQFLDQITFAVNYGAFVFTIWLGLYIVLHNPRYPISWLTALALWSMAVLFLHFMLEDFPVYFGSIFLSGYSFLQALVVAPALAFWHHATILMRPKQLNRWRVTRILAAYVIAVLGLAAQANRLIWITPPNCPPQFTCWQPGLLYPFFGLALLIIFVSCVVNLFRSARATPADLPHKQLLTLAYATMVAGIAGPTMIFGTLINLPVPMLVISLLMLASFAIMGYGVAHFSALMEGRTIRRDFFFNLGMVGVVMAIYIPGSWELSKQVKTPLLIIFLIPVLAVFTHTLVSLGYRLVYRLSLYRETRQMRSDLQRLTRLAFEKDAFMVNLHHALEVICRSVIATYGIVLTFEESTIQTVADYHWQAGPINLPPELFKRDDLTHLNPDALPAPFNEAALLVPLYKEHEQFGVLILGCPVNGIRFADEEIERLLNPADMIGEAILYNQLRARQILQAVELTRVKAQSAEGWIPVEVMEKALRNLYDYSYLADSPLADLALVNSRLPYGSVTHLERGKMVNQVTLEALNKFNPGKPILGDPPPREWYPYLILKNAYIDGISNRDIMMRLYISEGTFNRIRRSAIRSVARALGEMETELRSV